jgi:hypothetical protein
MEIVLQVEKKHNSLHLPCGISIENAILNDMVEPKIEHQAQREFSAIRETKETDPNQEIDSLFNLAYQDLKQWWYIMDSNLPPDYFNQPGPLLTEATMQFIESAGDAQVSSLLWRAGEVVIEMAEDRLPITFLNKIAHRTNRALIGPESNTPPEQRFSPEQQREIAQIRYNIIMDRVRNFWPIQVRRPTIQLNPKTGKEMWVQEQKNSDPVLAGDGDYSVVIRMPQRKYFKDIRHTQEIFEVPRHNHVDAAIIFAYNYFNSVTSGRRDNPSPELTPYPLKDSYSLIIGPVDKPVKIIIDAGLLKVPVEEFLIQLRGQYIGKVKQIYESTEPMRPNEPKPKYLQTVKTDQEEENLDQINKQMLAQDDELQYSLDDVNDLTASDLRVFLADLATTRNARRIEHNKTFSPLGIRHPTTVVLSHSDGYLINVGARFGHSPHDGMGAAKEVVKNLDKTVQDIITTPHTYLRGESSLENPRLNPFYKSRAEDFSYEKDPNVGEYGITIGNNISMDEVNPVINLRAETNKDSFIFQQLKEKYGTSISIHTILSLALYLTVGIKHGHFLGKDKRGNLVPRLLGLPDSLFNFAKGNAFGTELTADKVANFVGMLYQVDISQIRIAEDKDSIRAMAAISDTKRDLLTISADILNPLISEVLTNSTLISTLVFTSKERADIELQGEYQVRLREFTTARAKNCRKNGGFGFCDAGDNQINVTYKAGEENVLTKRFPEATTAQQLEDMFRAEYLKNIQVVLDFVKEVAAYDKPLTVKQLLSEQGLQSSQKR